MLQLFAITTTTFVVIGEIYCGEIYSKFQLLVAKESSSKTFNFFFLK